MSTIVYIPAKTKSKRLPGKNFRPINGKSPVFRTIETALSFTKKSDIFVSSEECSIENEIHQYGVNFILRDSALAAHNVTNFEVIKRHIKDGSIDLCDYKSFLLLQPTTPFRDVTGLITLRDKFNANPKSDSVVTVVPKRRQYVRKERGFEFIQPIITNPKKSLQKTYEITGHAYLTGTSNITTSNSLLGNNIDYIFLPDNWPEIDLDNPRDWDLAEAYAKNYD